LALSPPQPLNAKHDVAQFSCGKPALDSWLKTRALSNLQKDFTVVIVITDDNRVVGYYGLAPTALVPSVMPRSVRTGQPPNPVPCILLGQLATDTAFAGRGIGSALVRHAFTRSVVGARLIDGRALVVNAIDEEASHFWKRRGFLPSTDDPLMLFRAISDVAASLQAAGISDVPPDEG
jgi:ribosomal protein S18 acetylase RimI-like enzyme